MIDNHRETSQSLDINSSEVYTSQNHDIPIVPSIGDLKEKMHDIFPKELDGDMERPNEMQVIPTELSESNNGTVTLEDGTKIELPGPVVYSSNVNDTATSSNMENGEKNTETNNTKDPLTQNIEGENGENTPNSTYEKDGSTYKTDDNGNVYMTDGKLASNSTYELNDSVYTTDDKGRITSCEAKPQRSPENPRDNDAQREAGGEDRKKNDQGGHIVGRDLNGDGGGGNLVAMDSKINQSDYKRMENDVKNSLDEGKDVTTKTDITYKGDSERPDKITVTVTADGEETVYKFDNNIDGSLKDEVPENGKEAVQAELDDTKGDISSIKEEYDRDGNLTKTTLNITYTDEDGATRRTKVVIDNTSGGEN